MTNLELLICEAENQGEISIDTRNNLLSVLTESESQLFKHARIFQKYNAKFPEFKNLTSELHSCEKELEKVDVANRSSLSVLLRLLVHLIKLLASVDTIKTMVRTVAISPLALTSPSAGIKVVIEYIIKMTINKFILCLSNATLVASDLTYARNASKELDKLINKEKDADKRDSYQNMKERLENAISAAEDTLASDSLIQTGNKAKDVAKTAIDKVFKKESTELEDSIFNAYIEGTIDEETMDSMLTVLTEGVFSNPLKKFIDKIKAIKKEKPSEYDGPAEVKKFVDKNYKDIITVSELLEKEPEELRKNDIKLLLANLGIICAWYASMIGGAFAGLVAIPIISSILALMSSIIIAIIQYSRNSNDRKAMDELSKIKNTLKKINISKLPEEYTNKISKMITAIDDAETEINAKIKAVNESSVDDIKISIYEAEINGDITAEEREFLLSELE